MNALMITITLAVVMGIGFATWRAPRLTSILIWTMLAATLIGSACMMLMPGDVTNNLIWLTLLFPLIWMALQFWCYWDASKWRVLGGTLALCIASGAVIFTAAPLGS